MPARIIADSCGMGTDAVGNAALSDRVQSAVDAVVEGTPTKDDAMLFDISRWVVREEPGFTVRLLAKELHDSFPLSVGEDYGDLLDALHIIARRPGVATVVTRLVTAAALWGRTHAPRFGDLKPEDLGALSQGIELEWLDQNGVPRRLQLLIVDALRCRLDVPGLE